MPVSARLRQVFRSSLGATIDLEPFLLNVAERRFPKDNKGADDFCVGDFPPSPPWSNRSQEGRRIYCTQCEVPIG